MKEEKDSGNFRQVNLTSVPGKTAVNPPGTRHRNSQKTTGNDQQEFIWGKLRLIALCDEMAGLVKKQLLKQLPTAY